jgi:CHAT domain-containing protein
LVGRSKIEASASKVYALLTSRNRHTKGETPAQARARIAKADADYDSAANELSELILRPVASKLGRKRLVVVADGMLQFIPFAALPDPNDQGGRVPTRGEMQKGDANLMSFAKLPLIWNHEVTNLPSASVLAMLREGTRSRKPASKAVAVFADPVFAPDDPRVRATVRTASSRYQASTGSSGTRVLPSGQEATLKSDLERAVEDIGDTDPGLTLPRLHSTRWEADQIISLWPKNSLKAVDFLASREVVMSDDLQQYRIVHFASHAIIDTINPQLSGLVLSLVDKRGHPRDGYLRASDIYQLKLSADLVVLSACRTGLGKDVRGEGMIGLMRGFMYAGAPRVVVSLWRVNDQATADLMARFYRKMATAPARFTQHPIPVAQLPPAAALRAAQIEMLKNRKWQSPYFWAGFTLQGEWK